MANNYQSRIELIVDDIAKDNVEFKTKTITQQNAQKTDMILSISKSIAGLNDVGQNLVLNDIEKEVRENRIDIIDSSGNINVTELTRFTSTLVKAKIDEYERQGINLRLDSQITKNNSKISVTETVLSVAVISDMVNNFKSLSYNDAKTIFDNWSLLTSTQKSNVLKSQSEQFSEMATQETNSEKRQVLEQASASSDFHSKQISQIETFTESQAISWIQNFLAVYPEFKKQFEILDSTGKSKVEIAKNLEEMKSQTIGKEGNNFLNDLNNNKDIKSMEHWDDWRFFYQAESDKQKCLELLEDEKALLELGIPQKDARRICLKSNEEFLKLYAKYAFISSDEKLMYFGITKGQAKAMSPDEIIAKLKQYQQQFVKNQAKNEQNNDETLLQEEIRQIPSELAKANYSQEQIKDILEKYKSTLEDISMDVIEKVKDKPVITKYSFLSKKLIKKFNISPEIADMLSKIDYNGKLFEILGNEEQRKTFFEQLDIVIENPNRQKPVSDPEYDKKVAEQGREVDLDASAAEASKEQQGRSERTSNVQEEPQEGTPTDTTGQADSSTAEHKPQDEVETPPVKGTESSQNMALVEQDNSFIGKIKRVLANMKDKKEKDSKKGFFSRLKESVKDVFGNSDNRYENETTESVTTQPQANLNENTKVWDVSEDVKRKTEQISQKAAYQQRTQDKSSKINDNSSSSKDEEEPMVP